MQTFLRKNALMLCCAAVLLVASAATAQEKAVPAADKNVNILGRRDLGAIVQQQHLDSYWLDQRMWYEYGYRPQVKMQRLHYPNYLPDGYYVGPDWTIKDKLELGDPAAKYKLQWGKDGTWH
mgnify:FL=1